MKKAFYILLSALVINADLCAQSGIWNTPDAYLGEKQPGDTPVVFAPGRLAAHGYWAGSRVAFTNDGRQFIYGTNTNWFDGKNQKLKYFLFYGKEWKGPFILINHFGTPTFSADGNTLYITGRSGAIYETHFADTGWVRPVEFFQRTYTLYNFMPTANGHYYVGSNGTWGNRQDFSSWKFSELAGVGSDSSIKNLGAPLNSLGFNGDFYVAPDESYMIISAKETASFQSELYISFRDQGKWLEPVSLGPLINDGLAHRWGAYVTPDRKFLFYTKGTSEKDCTIYWVRFDGLLEKLRPK